MKPREALRAIEQEIRDNRLCRGAYAVKGNVTVWDRLALLRGRIDYILSQVDPK